MLTLVLEMCVENQPVCNEFMDDTSEIVTSEGSKNPPILDHGVVLNDDNDVILPFRNPKLRIWNKKLRKKTDESSSNSVEDDSNVMVVDSTSSAVESSSCSMDLSTNMSGNSDGFK